mgnify:CR=1 FL=1|tara:strand:+ start:4526 stop:5800 length:1275 start_codon:yes stop_codon:yes gene_type:complete
MAFRFIHTADVHLDSPLRSLALRNPELRDLIGTATRQAFENTVQLCIDEEVDALLLAGDLYDGEQTSMKTARFLGDQIRKLHECGIRVFIIRGNHDAESKITKELVFPDTVKVFGSRADYVLIEQDSGQIPIVVHGISFAKPHAPESLLPKYKPPVAGAVNIGLMHSSLDGAPGHDVYAPCRLADLEQSGFRYWALGHIHKRVVHDGACMIVMPGIPQGRHVNESGPRSVSLVSISDDGDVRVEERFPFLAQFDRVRINVTGIEDWRDLANRIEHTLTGLRDAAKAEHVVTRLQLAGTTPLAWRIRRDRDLLLTEAEERANRIGSVWMEALDTDCDVARILDPVPGDPVSDLRDLIEGTLHQSDSFKFEASEIAEDLIRQLPPECRGFLGSDEHRFAEAIADLSLSGAKDVLARLRSVSGKGED